MNEKWNTENYKKRFGRPAPKFFRRSRRTYVKHREASKHQHECTDFLVIDVAHRFGGQGWKRGGWFWWSGLETGAGGCFLLYIYIFSLLQVTVLEIVSCRDVVKFSISIKFLVIDWFKTNIRFAAVSAVPRRSKTVAWTALPRWPWDRGCRTKAPGLKSGANGFSLPSNGVAKPTPFGTVGSFFSPGLKTSRWP